MKNFQKTLLMLFVIFISSSNFLLAQSKLVGAKNASTIHIGDSAIGTSKKINIGLGKVVILHLPSRVQDVLVSDPTKADVVVHSSKTVYIFGKSVGQANVILIGHDEKQLLNIDIFIERDISNLEMTFRRFLSGSNIHVEMLSDNLVLHGDVRTIQDSQHAVELSNMFLSNDRNNLYNKTASGSKVINLLNIGAEDQVTLKVTIAEVRRDVLKQIGFQHTISSGGPSKGNRIDFGGSVGAQGGDFAMTTILDRFTFKSVLNALERATAIRTLAEPTLTAISGQNATFRSGGTRLYRSIGVNGTSTITPHDYGVVLTFTPTVLSPGRIGLRIETEVSEPVLGVAVTEEPEYRMRKADTTVELPSGGTIVLAGLLKDDIQQKRGGVPLLSKIPILGALFRNSSFSREETEIFISATPFLVKPVAMNELSRPDDNYDIENDAKAFLFNRVNKIYGPKEAEQGNGQNYKGAIGFIYK
ncbi:pilus assembly protein CpaC [Candidatus Liberibacter solanacearum]|uniref:Type II/IV secretion system secretin RcpA/CpaC, associated with Flp pilus assembly n=1 Tax=Candidatus Liberibacter solanacearum TaxID=556287 RepID=A0A094Z190_9HYPH|nr:type II and III secretion system protein family protein [Candidatus Liberibacter solanacearum]KGB27387.1 pilus assembly protein CpaC [Candidatus Liberibacter solanacearum]KJZ80914.1 pilus assembly protein CpaC [Candidatus Liberibacter solanacearum]KJZ82062.1 Type II/IV secretion system secretin RcpA/CpaC, associated with Flp pilus assembly [Candidatus Liberibacter solanacearum]KQC49514.1 pilus assembly protein CpaC [Candidatus Liberibacter solanacearum]